MIVLVAWLLAVPAVPGLLAASAPAGDGPAPGGPPPAAAAEPSTSILVKLRPWVTHLQASGTGVTAGWIEVAVPPGQDVDEALAEWAARPEVEAVEPNLTVRAVPQRAVPVEAAAADSPDPLAVYQWHMDLVQAEAARAIADGSGVVVAVLDTGITPGSDLACHTLVHPYDATTRSPGAAADDSGHGTHVAGTVAQCTGNGIGVAGMAPGASLMPVKVLDRFGAGDFADLAAGLDWARANGAHVANLSLGGACASRWPDCGSRLVDEAIARAVDAGMVIVAASGNEGAAYPDYPANHPDVIGVGAVETRRLRPSYSNRGADLAAPGGESGVDRNGDGTVDGVIQESFQGLVWGYWARAGTSFASPHVSGAAALLLARVPGASAADVRGALQCTASDLAAPGWDTAAPSFPAGATLAAAAGPDGSVLLSWPPARDCDRILHYVLSRDGTPLGITTDLSTSAVGPGTYRIAAVDRAGHTSAAIEVAWTPPQVLAGTGQGDTVGLVDPGQGIWHLLGSAAGSGGGSFYYGNPGDVPFLGDWDCDGVATPGLYRQSDGYAYLRNSNTQGIADIRFFFGNPGDVPLAGDFDGDGCDTVSLYRPAESRVYVIDRLGDGDRGLGVADASFPFGDPGDLPLAGDVDADGRDEVGMARPATLQVFLRHELAGGPADVVLAVGVPGDRVLLVGRSGGTAEPAVWRPATREFHFPDGVLPVPWAEPGWLPVAG